MSRIDLIVNGKNQQVESDPATPLLYVLREELGLRAARFGCGQGTCGACTVIVDGKAVQSCDVMLANVAGSKIETAESLDGKPPHPLVAAFLDHQAGQCGYCLSGILMTAKALLGEHPDADRSQIAKALDDNLCRCGSHARILDAIEAARQTKAVGAG
ncbi:MAG: (2Fe-2S)-binding protein [Silicimonas sp.]|nr:(2Fe-2S)-binding protein [Silicimonas sp.]